jgi:tRNA modification GTPase
MRRLLAIAARIEATIDYDGEEEVAGQADPDIAALAAEIRAALAIPPAERLRDGLRVAIVGPPNAGKSTLFNALVGDEAAIVSATPGTTRDIIERPLSLGGLPIVLLDTAGIRSSDDPIEAAGIARALRQRDTADIILDLSGEVPPADHVLAISAKSDVALPRPGTIAVSAVSGDGLADLHWRLIEIAATLLPREGEVALDRRYREVLADVERELLAAEEQEEALLVAEHIRGARTLLDRLIGGGDVEAMLDALFGRFCLGK